MLSDFNDRDFAFILLSVENYSKSCLELVNATKEKRIPLYIISELVNIQRAQYGLGVIRHISHKDLQLDAVVSGSKYFFHSENLKLVLSTLIVVGIEDIDNTCKILMGVEKMLSFKISYTYDISNYIQILFKYK